MNVLFSAAAGRNFEYGGVSQSSILKKYYILFDQVFFDPFGLGQEEDFHLQWLMAATRPNDKSFDEHEKLKSKFQKSMTNLWAAVDSAEDFEHKRMKYISERKDVFSELYDFTNSEIKRKHGADVNPWERQYGMKGMIGDVWYDVAGNELAAQLDLDIEPSYSPLIGDALVGKIKSNTADIKDVLSKDLIIPNFDSFSWDQIFELRDDKYIKHFRKSLKQYLKPNTLTEVAYEMKIGRDLWRLVEEINPSVLGSTISGVLSNIPGLPVNPFGILAAMKDYDKEEFLEHQYGHLFFIHRAKAFSRINPALK